jgi:uncharacterized protein (DUF58 family)
MEDYKKYLDPRVLNKISKLDIKARLIVEGFIAGLHKSPYSGVSVEFATHREYVPGDDLRRLDWKLFGRSDRLYLKQYEQETNLSCHIIFDTSESMSYGSGEVSKVEYGRYIAASLAYLITQQQDAVGLVLFDQHVTKFIPPHSNPAHLNAIIKELSEAQLTNKTDIKTILTDVAERIENKGLVIIISDLFDNPESILKGLQRLRHKGQDIIIFNILDEAEVSFPFDRITKFIGLEKYPEILTDPRALRKGYLDAVNNFVSTLRHGCQKERIDYVQITTDQMLDVALSAYLSNRLSIKR